VAPAPTPTLCDADLAWALEAANRRVLDLEMTVAVLRYRLDRTAGRCAPPCRHAMRLADAESALRRMREVHSDFYRRLQTAVADIKDSNGGQR